MSLEAGGWAEAGGGHGDEVATGDAIRAEIAYPWSRVVCRAANLDRSNHRFFLI
jgi:hypothetical protein